MHFCNMRLIGIVWCDNIFALHRGKVEIQLITREFHHLYNLHHRIPNNLWHFWQVWNVSGFEPFCHPSIRSLFLIYLLMLFICLSKITSLLFSCSFTPRVTWRTLATTQVGESTKEKMEAVEEISRCRIITLMNYLRRSPGRAAAGQPGSWGDADQDT